MDVQTLTPLTPVPPVSPETEAFWDATATDRLLVKFCNSCNKVHVYPRAHCPFCFSVDTEWRESPGEGEIYSYTVIRRETPPRVVAYVRLDEGVILLTNIVGCDPNGVHIDQRVKAVFPRAEDGPCVPAFVPASPTQELAYRRECQGAESHEKD
ncbi:Zn-ribbon domain-containing OB-fold protein [Mesorhizobium ciceri]|uniref:Zn-ribbon domain-containing OB-fold protein n=1 Tax=Mesorhizobium TaxID=68287 RepID=UPI0009DDE719|nr:Zn-ribbon domain-containing OB-fold protein [Mesorhizobium ciceri]